MINVKPTIEATLKSVVDNVSECYPEELSILPIVQYIEEDNYSSIQTDNEEQLSYIKYRVDIWDDKTISEIAINIDKELSKLGLIRVESIDDIKQSNIRHKTMRFEGLIDVNTRKIFFNRKD